MHLLIRAVIYILIVAVVIVWFYLENSRSNMKKSETLRFDDYSYKKVEERIKEKGILDDPRMDDYDEDGPYWEKWNSLFKVFKKDGSEWLPIDLEQYVLEHPGCGILYSNIDGFYLNQNGDLFLADNSGNMMIAEGENFNILWNPEGF